MGYADNVILLKSTIMIWLLVITHNYSTCNRVDEGSYQLRSCLISWLSIAVELTAIVYYIHYYTVNEGSL